MNWLERLKDKKKHEVTHELVVCRCGDLFCIICEHCLEENNLVKNVIDPFATSLAPEPLEVIEEYDRIRTRGLPN